MASDRLDIPDETLPLGIYGLAARLVEARANRAEKRGLPFAPEAEGMLLADLHTDTLLWGVDPWEDRYGGQVDIPRLVKAKVRFQGFGGPTWTPLPHDDTEEAKKGYCVSRDALDQATALFPSDLWEAISRDAPARRRGRALLLAKRFQDMLADKEAAAREGAELLPIYTADDIVVLREEIHRGDAHVIGAMMTLEGLHWLSADATEAEVEEEVLALKGVGYRMLAPTHRFSNGLGGASEDCQLRYGLTNAGRAMVEACFAHHIALDLAHASPAVIREACGIALRRDKPVIVSHTGIRSAHPTTRNLSDEAIRGVAATGGLIGIGFWRNAIGFAEDDPYEAKIAKICEAFVATLDALSDEHFADEMLGRFGQYDPYEHIAFGSDFDGAVLTPFDVSGLSHVVAALSKLERDGERLFEPDKLRLIAGENTLRVMREALEPESGDDFSPGVIW